MSGLLFTLCSQAEYRIQHLAQGTTPGAELTQLGYPYQTSGSTECARAIVASNYGGGGPQVSEHLSIQGRVEIEGLCGGVGREQSVVRRFLSLRYIFRIFRTFFYTRYSHFLFLSDISHAFSVMIHAYFFMFLVLLMANSYLSFILSFKLDFCQG